MRRCREGFLLALLAAATTANCARSRGQPEDLNVSVAASLQHVMQVLAPLYERSHPATRLRFNFGGSGTLARQIEEGVPADVFFSAASNVMDRLAAKGLILSGTRRDLLRNQIVLIVPKDSTQTLSFDRLADSKVKLIALGEPASVPAGEYGRQTLVTFGVWEKVQAKLVLAKDVRQVLSYVETGNADAGIVYATDARDSQNVRVAAVAPPGAHADIVYPIAVLRGTSNATAARSFVSFLTGFESRDVFTRSGFTMIPSDTVRPIAALDLTQDFSHGNWPHIRARHLSGLRDESLQRPRAWAY